MNRVGFGSLTEAEWQQQRERYLQEIVKQAKVVAGPAPWWVRGGRIMLLREALRALDQHEGDGAWRDYIAGLVSLELDKRKKSK